MRGFPPPCVIATILALTLQLSLPLSAQDRLVPEYSFQQVHGVYVNTFTSNVVRDDEGYVWLGTPNGLFRYDGYGAKDYRNIPGELHSLSANNITALLVDKQKRLWIGTADAGVSLYDRGSDQFYNLLPHPGDSSWYDASQIYSLTMDRRGNIWLGTRYGGVVRMELPSDAASENPDTLIRHVRFTTFALGTSRNTGGDVYEMSNGKMLLCSDRGLIVLDPETHSISRLRFPGLAGTFLDSDAVNRLCPDSNGVFWAGTETKGLFRVDVTHATVRNYGHASEDALSLISNQINALAVGRNGYLWIGTTSGLQLFSPATGRAVPFAPLGMTSLGPCDFLSVDRSGTLWVTTDRMYWLSAKSQRFPAYAPAHNIGQSARLPFQVQRDRNGHLWAISGEGVLYQIDMATRAVVDSVRVLGKKEAAKTWVYLFIDQRGICWLGTGHGLFRVNLENGLVRHYDADPGLPPLTIWSIAQASGDSLWIAAGRFGLKKFDPVRGKFTDVPGFERSTASMVMRDRHRRLWVCSSTNGLAILDPTTGHIERFRHNPTDPRSLSSDHCSNAYEDPAGRTWVAAGTDVDLWDSTTHSFTRYSNGEQKHAQYSFVLGSDRNGRLWVSYSWSTTAVLDPSTGIFTNYDETDGLFSAFVPTQNLPDGTIVVPSWVGVNIFHPDSIESHRPAPPLVLTRMSINDQPVISPRLTGPLRPVNLSFSQNTFEFEFAAIDIDAPTQVKYEYRLDGFEKQWSSPNDRRFVRYPNIPPGDYIFNVRASSIRAEWPDQEIALSINIAPPWWRTTWAYTGYGLFIIAILFGGYRLRLRQVQLKQAIEMEHFQAEHLAEVDRLKSRFFSNISHEFRTPLTLILGPADQLTEIATDPSSRQKLGLIRDNAKKLFALVNQLLDFSRLESGMMRLQVSNGDIVQFLRRVVMSFESWAERKHTGLEFRSDAESITGYFDADKLEKIVNNLMSNALKFTPEGGRVWVHISHSPALPLPTRGDGERRGGKDPVIIAISDTGPGIPGEHLPRIFDRFYRVDETHTTEGTGIGLALTKELVDLHHGTITVESMLGKGSMFTVALPIEQSAYAPNEITEPVPQIERQEQGEPDATSEESRPVPTAAPAGGKPVVLIVEDNADLRAYIREYLEADYAVQEAGNGKEGYDQATEIVPDLVISDIMMPQMNGMELCRALKQDVRTSHVPVILLTARAGTDSKIEGLEIGADDYVTKPFEAKELGARVRNLIEQRRLLRKKFSAGVVLKPGEVAVTSLDDALLKRSMEIIEKNIGDENFGVDDLAREACLSRSHLNRKLHALTNLAPAEFIRYVRLQRAHELLEKNAGTIAEVAYQVGFASPSYFSTCFRERFGFPPSEVQHKTGAANDTRTS
jgi:signal transduction histidine kinase/ligand-binding sensor domain-containing protein/DNA-binding NarL/FixJ family response regulator